MKIPQAKPKGIKKSTYGCHTNPEGKPQNITNVHVLELKDA